jgi:hypothetical protein
MALFAFAHVVGMVPPPPVPVPLLLLEPLLLPVPVPLLIPLPASLPVLELVPESTPESTPATLLVLLAAGVDPTAVLEVLMLVVVELLVAASRFVQSPCAWIDARYVPHPVSSSAERVGVHSMASAEESVAQHVVSVAQLVPEDVAASSDGPAWAVAHASATIPSANAARAEAIHILFASFMFKPFVASHDSVARVRALSLPEVVGVADKAQPKGCEIDRLRGGAGLSPRRLDPAAATKW